MYEDYKPYPHFLIYGTFVLLHSFVDRYGVV